MSNTPENKPTTIIARMPEFRGWNQEEVERQLIRMEVTPALFNKPLLPPSAWVVGTSLRDIYEAVLGKCNYEGMYADSYIRHELTKIHKIVPILVKEDTLQGMLQIKKEKTLNTALQLLINLPLKFAIERTE